MTDSSPSYQHFIEAGRLALGRGDRDSAEEALSAALQASEGLADVPAQYTAALIELGVVREEMGCHDEAEALLRQALDVGERALGPDDPGLIRPLTRLGAVLVARGAPEEAEPLLTRALSISEHHLGPNHPDLVVLLNELTRLYLGQSAHAFAEPLLVRLHAIKRRKGEEHPEVATVLASLADVQRALGRHDAAEQLRRRVLEIRERTLAPNHFAIAVALEHLAETCAARGNFAEALPLLQRALTIRELTLGASHPSLRLSRDRIADLQLQASEGSLDPPDQGAQRAERERQNRLQAAGAGPAPQLLMEAGAPPEPAESAAPSEMATAPDEPTKAQGLVLPYLDGLPHVQNEQQTTAETESPAGRARTMMSSAAAEVRKRPTSAAITGVSAVALLMAGFGMNSHARAGKEQTLYADVPARQGSSAAAIIAPVAPVAAAASTASTASVALAARTATAVPATDSSTRVHVAPPVASLQMDALPRSIAAKATSRSRPPAPYVAEGPPVPKPSAAAVADSAASADSAATSMLPPPVSLRLDSLVHVLNTKTNALNEPLSAQLATSLANSQYTAYRLVESLRKTTEARVLGPLPQPAYPPGLRERHVEGEVFVQFMVDTAGRPDMSTLQVVRSPHYLLTAAVRDVVPRIRFEPARAAGVEARPLSVMAGVSFKFVAYPK